MDIFARTSRQVNDAPRFANEFNQLFARTFLMFHRREKRDDPSLTPQSRMLLLHLSLSGPLTIGEIARHIERAQSVVSETVDALEKRGFLARVRDPRDRRRTLVWLTDLAIQYLARDQEVLDTERLRIAFSSMVENDSQLLVSLLEQLVLKAESQARSNIGKEKTT